MHKYPMTVKGAEALRNELTRLKSVERPRIIESIASARAHGDLKENAEYHAAREEQSFTEGRIRELESKLSHAQIIDVTQIANHGKVIFGATVTVFNVSTSEELIYQIVGEDESDIQLHKISFTSPIGRSLIGKEVGEAVIVDAPGGRIEYEVVSVDYVG